MKRLLLMRHGKSDWNKPGQDDSQRPLAPRGHRAALRIAAWIEAHALSPDVALVSTARRTLETWDEVESVLGEINATRYRDELYLATPGELLAQLAEIDNGVARAIVVGHNPGLESLAHLLAGPGTVPQALDDLRRGFPTAGLAVFELAGNSWSRLGADGARLVEFVRPGDLD